MNFIPLTTLHTDINIDLEILKRHTQRNNILLYQHEGTLKANDKYIGNANDVSARFSDFFKLAKEKNVDLAMTPEYSCPFTNIIDVISNKDKWPSDKKLWAIGCESISKEDLKVLKANYNKEDVKIIFEDDLFENPNNYFDPLVYLFVSNNDSIKSLIVLIQFKTEHMGVWNGPIERDNYIPGNNIYVFNNSHGESSIRLFTLICSEAINFKDKLTLELKEKLQWNDLPFLILNPQLNPKPAHPDFINFRNTLLSSEYKEIISLNWSLRTKYGSEKFIKNKSSRSGFYIKSNEINLNDINRIKKNHARGLYYYNLSMNNHFYGFNSNHHIYLVATLPVKINAGVPAQQRRDGPEIKDVYSFDEGNILIEQTLVSDNHLVYLFEVGCSNAFTTDSSTCIIEKERLVYISSGFIPSKNSLNWYLIQYMDSFKMENHTESNKRFTVLEDVSEESGSRRKTYLAAINELTNNILPNKSYYPDSIADLKNFDVMLGYCSEKDHNNKKIIEIDKYKYNLCTSEGKKISATICYLDSPENSDLENTFEALQSLFDSDNNNKGRVVVFYKRGATIASRYDKNAGKFSNTNDLQTSSFLKD